MARALMAAGVPTERAYALATPRRRDLAERGGGSVDLDRLEDARGRGARRGARAGGSCASAPLPASSRELDLPIMLLVGGATGTGKSTVATEVALPARDHARHLDRLHPPDDARVLLARRSCRRSTTRASTAGRRVPRSRRPDRVRLPRSSRATCSSACERAIDRALTEGWSMVLEGVHLVPGLVPTPHPGDVARRRTCVLAIEDETCARTVTSYSRGGLPDRPIDEVPRAVRRHPPAPGRLSSSAPSETGVPVIENENADRATSRARWSSSSGRPSVWGACCDRPRSSGRPAPRPARRTSPCLCRATCARRSMPRSLGARWLGRADQEAAEEAASARRCASRSTTLPIRGRVVLGSPDDAGGLAPGATVGSGGEEVDLALDPLEGRGVVARGGNGAMSMIAVGEPRRLCRRCPTCTCGRWPSARARAARSTCRRPVARQHRGDRGRVRAAVNDVTTIILDRPRHHDLIEEIRNAGARIKLIQDGDVTAAISAADPRHERPSRDRDRRHPPGGALRRRAALPRRRAAGAVLAHVAAPRSRRSASSGSTTTAGSSRTEDLAPREVIVAATGVSNGDLLRGVRFLADSARTHSLVMCTRCNWVRFVDGDPLLRPRAARGSAAARVLARACGPLHARARRGAGRRAGTTTRAGRRHRRHDGGGEQHAVHRLPSRPRPASPNRRRTRPCRPRPG